MIIYMAMDKETRRVLAQSREIGGDDLPRGLRGVGWPQRQVEVDLEEWEKLLTAGAMSPSEQDEAHRRWWDAAGDPQWPFLEGES